MKRMIPYDEIKAIEKIEQEKAIELLNEKVSEEFAHRNNKSFSAFKSRKNVNETIKYTSVPVIFTSTRSFRSRKRTTVMKGEFVLLRLADGQNYILSPQDIGTFIVEIKKRMQNK